MNIERFETPGLAQYSYIVSSHGKAAVIDPIRDIDRYMNYLAERELTLTHILETHIHADFAAGSVAIAEQTGAELAVSAYDEDQQYRYAMAHRALRNGDSLMIGSLRLQALHTPGHTPEHLSFILFDTDRSQIVPMALFSGDFLFVGSLGRPDLLGEEAKLGLAGELFRSLHERLNFLPDGVQVFPGHGAGSLCGAGLSERAESTLGVERGTNQLFNLDQEGFISNILSSVPPMPSYYPRMKELNARGAKAAQPLPGGKPFTPEELNKLRREHDVVVLDLRRPEAFGGAHLPGAINIGAGQNLSLWAGWLLDPGSPIVLVNDEGDDIESRKALLRVGLDHLLGYLAGGMPAWIDAGFELSRITQLSVGEVEHRSNEAFVLDVRSSAEWKSGHIEGAHHVMLGDLADSLNQVPQNSGVITVCGSGYRSSIAASLLKQRGIEDVSSMDGGMTAWAHQHLKTVQPVS